MLLVVTGSLGLGFGLTLGAISTYAGAFQPQRREVALTALNVLLGLGTALVSAAHRRVPRHRRVVVPPAGHGDRPGRRLDRDARPAARRRRAPAAGGSARPAIPARFWLFAAALVAYGAAETMFGNWGTTLLVDDGVAGVVGDLRARRVLGGRHRRAG